MYQGKRIISMIPVKMNSERVKDKNIRPFFDGKPLVSCIAETVSKCKYIDDIYIYCSDEKIKDYIPDKVKFLQRPNFLNGNDYNCNDIIREFIKVVDADIYSVSHATAPFTHSTSIDKCIQAVADNNKYDSAILVKKVQTFLWNQDGAINFDPHHFPRTQDLEPIYTETSGAFVFTRDVFQTYDCRYGKYPCFVEASEIESLDIDTEEEMLIAQVVYKYQIENEQ